MHHVACWAKHGEYKRGHRCQHTDRGHRRQDPAPSVEEFDQEAKLKAEQGDGGEGKAVRGDGGEQDGKMSHEQEAKLGIIKANLHGQVLLKTKGNAVQCIVVCRDPVNMALFTKVYKAQHRKAPPLSDLEMATFGEPLPYLEEGVQFEYGEQSNPGCFGRFRWTLPCAVVVAAADARGVRRRAG
jgi:hypothetical protein